MERFPSWVGFNNRLTITSCADSNHRQTRRKMWNGNHWTNRHDSQAKWSSLNVTDSNQTSPSGPFSCGSLFPLFSYSPWLPFSPWITTDPWSTFCMVSSFHWLPPFTHGYPFAHGLPSTHSHPFAICSSMVTFHLFTDSCPSFTHFWSFTQSPIYP